eukprot:4755105-Prymnesium_polylepis.1
MMIHLAAGPRGSVGRSVMALVSEGSPSGPSNLGGVRPSDPAKRRGGISDCFAKSWRWTNIAAPLGALVALDLVADGSGSVGREEFLHETACNRRNAV